MLCVLRVTVYYMYMYVIMMYVHIYVNAVNIC